MRRGFSGRFVIDTTYILPLFGVRAGLESFEEVFPKFLSSFEVYYSPLSLVEAKWIVLRLARRLSYEVRGRLLHEYRLGLDTLLYDSRLKQTVITNSDIEEIADKLLDLGVHDYFDRMIYATACYYRAVLLTEDDDLHDVYAKVDGSLRPARIVRWSKVVEVLRGVE